MTIHLILFRDLYRAFFTLLYIILLCLLFSAGASADNDTLKGHEIRINTAVINVSFAPGKLGLSRTEIFAWISTSSKAIESYYGQFPVKTLPLLITPVNKKRAISGVTYGGDTPYIIITLSSDTTAAELAQDWVLVHELVHLSFPQMHRKHHWLEEGLATYIEPLVRLQAGMTTEKQVWRWFIEGLPNGLPKTNDRGLDYTPTWGRTYWGGTLFCLLADMEIRKKTQNRYSLQDAMRGVLQSGGGIRETWNIRKALSAADQTIGVAVFNALYTRMEAQPVGADLDSLWLKLGVKLNDGGIEYNDNAPYAWLRHALMGKNDASIQPSRK